MCATRRTIFSQNWMGYRTERVWRTTRHENADINSRALNTDGDEDTSHRTKHSDYRTQVNSWIISSHGLDEQCHLLVGGRVEEIEQTRSSTTDAVVADYFK